MKSDFIIALTQLAAERNLPREIVLSAIEAALVSAYRRDSVAAGQDISVTLDPGSGDVGVHLVKTVVEEVTDPQMEMSLAEAQKIKSDAAIDEVIPTESLPHSAGRIAAQTAKQVVIQRLREAERDLIFQEYADKESEVFTVTVQRIEPKQITVELGRAEAILPPSEQGPHERYRVGMKIKVLLQSIRQSNKGPELIVSRADKQLLRRLFEMEVPEIYNGSVEIMAIAREAGWRSKVAVHAKQDGVDAVGSCVGLRGIRIQNIVNELHGEKIDVVQWSKEPATFIANALSPSMVMRVDVVPESGTALAVVPERHLSLAIGKEGQNARMAAKLTGWKVDIKSNVEVEAADKAGEAVAALEPESAVDGLGLTTRTLNSLKQAGIEKVGQLVAMDSDHLLQLKGIGNKSVAEILTRLDETGLLPVEAEPEVPEEVEEKAEVAPEAIEEAAPQVSEAPPEQEVAPEPTAEVEAGPVKPLEPVAAGVEAAKVEAAPVPEETPAQAGPTEGAPAKPFVFEEATPPQEPVPVAESSTSLHELPAGVWATRGRQPEETSVIRFAEDIQELRERGGSRRGRRGGGARRGRARTTRRR